MEQKKFSRTDILRKVIELQVELKHAIDLVGIVATGEYGAGLFKSKLYKIDKALEDIRRFI